MPLTVGQVAALPDLGLQVRTGGSGLDREVRWVAVSELPDPTPWIEPGDLLLTTGMSIARATRIAASTRRGCTTSVTSWMVPPVCRLAVLRTARRCPAGSTLS